jgi:two-component system KDP operon response regulator KdpE
MSANASQAAVRALRQKLEAQPSQPRLIVNEPGVGYRLNLV